MMEQALASSSSSVPEITVFDINAEMLKVGKEKYAKAKRLGLMHNSDNGCMYV